MSLALACKGSASAATNSAPVVDLITPGFARVSVNTRKGPVAVVLPRRSYEFNPAGNTYFLATSGADTNSGSIEKPWKTFAHAVRVLQPGDLLYVRGGDYAEPFVIRRSGKLGKPIIVSSYPLERVHIFPPADWEPVGTHGANTIELNNASHIWIHGLEVEGYSREFGRRPLGTPVISAIQLTGGVGCRILNNLCYKAQYSGIKDQTGTDDFLVEGNLCFDNGTPIDNAFPRGAGVYLPGPATTGTIVRGNAIFRNGASGFSHYHRPSRHHIYNNVAFENGADLSSFGFVTSGSFNVYAHNISARNTGWGFSLYDAIGEGAANANLVLNNIFYGSTAAQLDKGFEPGNGNLIDHSIIFPAEDWPSQPWMQQILGQRISFVDPLFVDGTANDFRLQEASLARSAAGAASLLGARSQKDIGIFPATGYWEPELMIIGPLMVDEGSTLIFTNRLVDPNPPTRNIKFLLADGSPAGAVIDPISGVFTWIPDELQGPGTHKITVVAVADNSPIVSSFQTVSVTVREADQPTGIGLPMTVSSTRLDYAVDSRLQLTPYPNHNEYFADDGSWLVNGSTTFKGDGAFEVTAGGYWFSDRRDNFHFTSSLVTGDFDMRVRVASLTTAGDNSWAGLLVKESLAIDSRAVWLVVRPEGAAPWGTPGQDSYLMASRTSAGAYGVEDGRSPDVHYPNGWARLQRNGRTFTGYRSDDGVNWTQVGQRVFTSAFPELAFVGLLTRAQNPDLPAVATYDNFQIAYTDAGPLTDQEVGFGQTLRTKFVLRDADYPPQSLTFSLERDAPAGAMIDPTTGAFSWTPAQEQSPSTNRIVVRVTDTSVPSLESTNSFTVVVISPPHIVTQPESQTVDLGKSSSFGFTAKGTWPLSYQWLFQNSEIPGATNTMLTLDNLRLEQAGSYSVRISNAYGTVTSAAADLTVKKIVQTITFLPPPDKTYGDAPFEWSATSDSGLPVSLSVLSGPATINGQTVTIRGAGAVIIQASQSGDAVHAAAAEINVPSSIAKATLTITVNDAVRAYRAADPAFTTQIMGLVNNDSLSVITGSPVITTPATSENPVGTYPLIPQVGTLAAANYNFSFHAGTLTISKADQSITFDPIQDQTFGDPPLALNAKASSSLPVTFAVMRGPAALEGSALSSTGVGLVTIKASQEGNENYNPALAVERSFNIRNPEGPLGLSGVTVREDSFTFEWKSRAGSDYQIEYKTSLSEEAWIPLQVIRAASENCSFSAPISRAPARFYRIRTTP